jgi:hypothetical protein
MKRWASSVIALSSRVSKYHDGIVFQAVAVAAAILRDIGRDRFEPTVGALEPREPAADVVDAAAVEGVELSRLRASPVSEL